MTRELLRGFFFGYSQCPHCKHRLVSKDLVPVLSYLIQGKKCRYCGERISWLYPLLELLCAVVFLLTYFLLKDFWTPTLIFWLLTNRLLVLLLVYDFKEYELHMVVWILLAVVWILANIFVPGDNLRYALLSALLFAGVFTGIYFFAKRYAKMRFKKVMEWFGEGDIYLAATIWIFIPLIMSASWIIFSWWTIACVLILFILLSSIIGLIRAWLQYLFGWRWKVEGGKLFHQSSLSIIPFFPAMIISFWLIAWKLNFFISLLFPLVW